MITQLQPGFCDSNELRQQFVVVTAVNTSFCVQWRLRYYGSQTKKFENQMSESSRRLVCYKTFAETQYLNWRAFKSVSLDKHSCYKEQEARSHTQDTQKNEIILPLMLLKLGPFLKINSKHKIDSNTWNSYVVCCQVSQTSVTNPLHIQWPCHKASNSV